ncbi:ferrous iron transport protein A [Belliella marina]|uniref:Ferrous iron transport protein A n=1 Tax=Belliella marina TaxID=1644146 RepID=A0ABW4VGQ7_9BACT
MKASEISRDITYLIEKVIPSEIDVNLLEIGVVEGKTIKLIRRAPFSGAFAFQIGENFICMRTAEAELIQVISEN